MVIVSWWNRDFLIGYGIVQEALIQLSRQLAVGTNVIYLYMWVQIPKLGGNISALTQAHLTQNHIVVSLKIRGGTCRLNIHLSHMHNDIIGTIIWTCLCFLTSESAYCILIVLIKGNASISGWPFMGYLPVSVFCRSVQCASSYLVHIIRQWPPCELREITRSESCDTIIVFVFAWLKYCLVKQWICNVACPLGCLLDDTLMNITYCV